ncbi:MAG TPA: PIN domain-containing protein, partial [Candidatus Thermoplasmatota archaeon]|nr:PIN domain-containing protein [Candidatus Thermoplasmatota archaeon]
MTALIDTGVLFAFLYRPDARHAEAETIVREILLARYGVAFVPDAVVHELFTLIRARTKDARLERRAFDLLFGENPFAGRIRFLPCGPDIHREAFKVFDRSRDERLSFVDACLVALKDDLQSQILLTFDDALGRIASGR